MEEEKRMAAAHEAYKRERHGERAELAKRGMAAKAAAGGTNGPAPLGYVNRRRGDRAWVEVDPVAGPLVKEAFALAGTGRYSVRGLAHAMAETGLRSRQGAPLSHSTLHGMLSNPYYCGTVVRGGKLRRGAHEGLVRPAEFAKAQEKLEKRRHSTNSAVSTRA